MNFKIEKYEKTSRVRDWGSCQENDSSESAYYNVTEPRYRILFNDVVVCEDLCTEKLAEESVAAWSKSSEEIEKIYSDKKEELAKKALDAQDKLKRWGRAQKTRRDLLLKGEFPQDMKDLGGLYPR